MNSLTLVPSAIIISLVLVELLLKKELCAVGSQVQSK